MAQLSFRLKTVLGIAIIQGVLLLILVLGNLNFLNHSFDEELNKRAEASLRLFIASSKDAVISTDLATLGNAIDELLATPGVIYARVYDYDKLLGEGGDTEVLRRPFKQDAHFDQVDDGIFDTSEAIVVDDYRFGHVEIGMDVDAIAGMLDDARRQNIGLALSAVLLVGLFSAMLGGYLTRQLRSLTNASHAIAEGRIDTLIKVSGNDELAETARAFNHMSTRLQSTYSELQQASTFYEHTTEAIMITDADNIIIDVNPAFTRITGYSEEDVLGKDPHILSSGRHEAAFYHTMMQSLAQQGRWQGEIWNRRKSGEIYAEWLSIVAIKSDTGELLQYMSLFSDITKRKQDEERIWQQANFDALTGLPNRTLFMDRLSQALQGAHRETGMFALMFIDLDRFKWVNDTLGHNAGDLLLQEAATRLTSAVRESDTVARLGGDEFTVILPKIDRGYDVEVVAEKILHALEEPFFLEGREVFISGSVGITVYPHDADDVEGLVRNADAAMYRAKESGRNAFCFYTQNMNEAAQHRLLLESELRKAVKSQKLALHYQPLMNLNTGEVAGAEALLRWNHATLGMVPPDEFIPLAEELGIIEELEQWTLRQACLQAAEWDKHLFISVNISGVQLRHGNYHEFVERVLNESGLAPERLKLEITERLMIDGGIGAAEQFKKLRVLGVSIAIDDFGTGYSSLSYLKRFPVNVLKVDRSFVNDLPEDGEARVLIHAMVAMATSLEMEIVAEGVEQATQEAMLKEMGIDLAQGFHYAKALNADDFAAWIRTV